MKNTVFLFTAAATLAALLPAVAAAPTPPSAAKQTPAVAAAPVAPATPVVPADPARSLLSGKYTEAQLASVLVAPEKWTPFPRASDRAFWDNIDPVVRANFIRDAEKHLNFEWKTIPATFSLAFRRTGNRSNYDVLSRQKRAALGALLYGELAENKGRFVDQIINGVWSICEESWWGSSAHLPRGKGNSLHDVTNPFVDLYVGTTGASLAWADYFLGEKFDAVSPNIRPRIRYEINRRLLEPVLSKTHGWFGNRDRGPGPNNWNPWICSNWLVCALLIETDVAARAKQVNAVLSVADNFFVHYPKDGGCDEGPNYWGSATGSFYDCVSLLNLASNNAFSYVYSNQKFRNMGAFKYKTLIAPGYAVNFADAPPKASIDGVFIWRFGRDLNDANMMAFGAIHAPKDKHIGAGFRGLQNLLALKDFEKVKGGSPYLRDVWLPDLQVAMARKKEGATGGFYFAAKGGTNGESHNHNDIGNVIVYYDGQPLLIDIGSGKYTAQTFSGERYKIWNMRSEYHNTATINGVLQQAGRSFRATGASYKTSEAEAVFSLDISRAYPKKAGVKSWRRSVRLGRGEKDVVEIRDAAILEKADSVVLHFMTCHPAKVATIRGGSAVIISVKDPTDKTVPEKQFRLALYQIGASAEAASTKVTVEKIPLTTESDEGVLKNWGDTIRRINFSVKNPGKKLSWIVVVSRVK
ncbi:MAG: heparinase II/III-family protein [Puniceicoccales bacterium]|jgi:hypothetical protein|nr:heparinase II/III-family protein [Puniceicoccales bacterium]